MEMIDKIGKKAADTYHHAAKATGKLAREIKLKTMLSENKAKVTELYENIGKNVYEKYLLEEQIEIQNELLHDCTMIDIIASEVEDIRMELLKLRDLKQCPYCHYEIDLEYSFCPNCGKEQKAAPENQTATSSATILTTDEQDSNLTKIKDSDEETTEETI